MPQFHHGYHFHKENVSSQLLLVATLLSFKGYFYTFVFVDKYQATSRDEMKMLDGLAQKQYVTKTS